MQFKESKTFLAWQEMIKLTGLNVVFDLHLPLAIGSRLPDIGTA